MANATDIEAKRRADLIAAILLDLTWYEFLMLNHLPIRSRGKEWEVAS